MIETNNEFNQITLAANTNLEDRNYLANQTSTNKDQPTIIIQKIKTENFEIKTEEIDLGTFSENDIKDLANNEFNNITLQSDNNNFEHLNYI